MTLSGYFMAKCVFGQHFLCRARYMLSPIRPSVSHTDGSVDQSEIVQPRRLCCVLCIARSVSQPR